MCIYIIYLALVFSADSLTGYSKLPTGVIVNVIGCLYLFNPAIGEICIHLFILYIALKAFSCHIVVTL